MKNEAKVMIRRARPQDTGLLSDVGSRAFAQAYGGFFEPADVKLHIARTYSPDVVASEIIKGSVAYFLAEVDGRPAGLGKVREAQPPSSALNEKSVEVHQLYILSGFWRQGLGGYLMDAILNEARSRDADLVWLSVWEGADWAQSFYLRCGFTKAGAISFTLGSAQLSDVVMHKRLGRT